MVFCDLIFFTYYIVRFILIACIEFVYTVMSHSMNMPES